MTNEKKTQKPCHRCLKSDVCDLSRAYPHPGNPGTYLCDSFSSISYQHPARPSSPSARSHVISLRLPIRFFSELTDYCAQRNFSPTAFVKQIVLKEINYYLGGDIKNE